MKQIGGDVNDLGRRMSEHFVQQFIPATQNERDIKLNIADFLSNSLFEKVKADANIKVLLEEYYNSNTTYNVLQNEMAGCTGRLVGIYKSNGEKDNFTYEVNLPNHTATRKR